MRAQILDRWNGRAKGGTVVMPSETDPVEPGIDKNQIVAARKGLKAGRHQVDICLPKLQCLRRRVNCHTGEDQGEGGSS